MVPLSPSEATYQVHGGVFRAQEHDLEVLLPAKVEDHEVLEEVSLEGRHGQPKTMVPGLYRPCKFGGAAILMVSWSLARLK